MTVIDLFSLYDMEREYSCFYIWSKDGNVQYGLVNSYYSKDNVDQKIWKSTVLSFSVGFNSLHVMIEPVPSVEPFDTLKFRTHS